MFARPFLTAALSALAVLAASAPALAQAEPKPAATHARDEGRFIKGSSPAVYTVRFGKRRWISNPECYYKLAGKRDFSDTATLPDAEVNAIPEGPPAFCDGDFVKFPNSPAVYQYSNGALRWLNDPTCAFQKGVKQDWSNIYNIDAKWENSYGYGKAVCGAGKTEVEGRFIKASSPAVYTTRGGQKRWIGNPAVYFQLAGKSDFSDTETVSDDAVKNIAEAAPIFGNGDFVKFANSPAVYQVVSGHLRWLNDPPCAFANGVKRNWSNINNVDAKFEASFAYGKSVCGGGRIATR